MGLEHELRDTTSGRIGMKYLAPEKTREEVDSEIQREAYRINTKPTERSAPKKTREEVDSEIQRGPYRINTKPTERQTARQEALDLGIDPYGMLTKDVKRLVKAATKERDEMRSFSKKSIEAAKRRKPPVEDPPRIEKKDTIDPPAAPAPPAPSFTPRPKIPEQEAGSGSLPPSHALGDLLQGDGSTGWESCVMTPTEGDITYFNGTKWDVVPAPSGGLTHPVLSYDGTANAPMWDDDAGGSDTIAVVEADALGQLAVSNTVAGATTTYKIRGNSNNGSLTYTVDGGSAIDLIAWQDGLVTSYSAINIPITTGGSGLPTGYLGDMLYFDGGEWTRLEAPSAPASGTVNLLTHDGTAPAWVNKTIANISVCDGGSPATWQIIKWGVVIP